MTIAWTGWYTDAEPGTARGSGTGTRNYQAGCTKAGPECDHCYAELMSARIARMGGPDRYQGVVENGRWTRAIHADLEALHRVFDDLEGARRGRAWFLGSMTDLFHADVPAAVHEALAARLAQLQDRMDQGRTAAHVLQLLTKRASRLLAFQRAHFPEGLPRCVWAGVTAGTRASWRARVPVLAQVRAAVRWVSMEPLLTPFIDAPDALADVDWLVVGGESGPGARPTPTAWVQWLVEAARAAHVPIFVKQLGSVWAREAGASSRAGADVSAWPEHLRVQEFPAVWRP